MENKLTEKELGLVGAALNLLETKKSNCKAIIEKTKAMAETDSRQFSSETNLAFKLMLGGTLEEAIEEATNQNEEAHYDIEAIDAFKEKYVGNEEVMRAIGEFTDIIYKPNKQ